MGEFPGLEKHFKDGNIAFFNDTPQLDDMLVWRGQRMKVREFAALGLKEQIAVTKMLNGEWLAREKSVYEREVFEATIELADLYGVPRKGRNGGPDMPGRPDGWDRFKAMSREEMQEKVTKIMKERIAAKMANSPV